MILPAKKYFYLAKGVTFDYRFMYATGSSLAPSPIDLTGYTASWDITLLNGTHYTTYSTAVTPNTSGVFIGGDSQSSADGIIDLVITAADTQVIPWSSAEYTLTLTDRFGKVYLLMVGAFGLLPIDVTPPIPITFVGSSLGSAPLGSLIL